MNVCDNSFERVQQYNTKKDEEKAANLSKIGYIHIYMILYYTLVESEVSNGAWSPRTIII